MLYGFILSLSLHVPDVDVDRRNGKKTIAARKGRQASVSLTLISAVLASFAFIAYSCFDLQTVLNLGFVFVLSLLPLVTVVFGFLKFYVRREVTGPATLNIVSLFVFNAFLLVYLVFTVFATQLKTL
jgi:1,4-dihydroxy-2-naphthoate octaprenyltransferase